MHRSADDKGGWRLPTQPLEKSVTSLIADFLVDRRQLQEALDAPETTPDHWRALFDEAVRIAEGLTRGNVGERRTLLQDLVSRITLSPERLEILLDRRQLAARLGVPQVPNSSAEDEIEIGAPIRLKRRGVETKLVIEPNLDQQPHIDKHLVSLIARARRWFEEISEGNGGSIQEIAERENRDPSDIGRELQLAFLASDIVEAILAGRQPIELTARRLRHLGSLPADWHAQREFLGFTA